MAKYFWGITIALVFFLACLYLANSHDTEFTRNTQAYRVDRVVDGDTVKVWYRGKSEYVRLIGVDTPETVKPNMKPQYYGKEASTFLKNLLKGERVYLLFDRTKRDRYKRLLGYIYRAPDGMFVNAEIVKQGYGKAYTRFRFTHRIDFVKYEKHAKKSKKGLWARN